MTKIYDFDTPVSRRNTNCEKWDGCKKIFGTDNVIPVWIADMDFKTPDFIIDALKKRLEHEILGYTFRPASFYESLKKWVKRRSNWEINIDDLTFSPGILPAINFAVDVFTEKNDKIIISTPVYHPFIRAVNDHCRTLVTSPLVNDNGYYAFDFEDFEKKAASGVKMYIMCNPHNPVGRVWKREELERIAEICIKYDVIVVSDEIHSDLIYRPNKHIHFASLSKEAADRTITFLTPNKTFNIAGLSASAVHAPNKKLLAAFNKYMNDLHVNQGNIFGNIAFEAAYDFGDDWLEQLLKYLEGNINYVIDFIDKNIPRLKAAKPEGTYLLWIDCTGLKMDSSQLTDFMINNAGLAFNQGVIFGEPGKNFVRMNIAAPRDLLKIVLTKLKNAVYIL